MGNKITGILRAARFRFLELGRVFYHLSHKADSLRATERCVYPYHVYTCIHRRASAAYSRFSSEISQTWPSAALLIVVIGLHSVLVFRLAAPFIALASPVIKSIIPQIASGFASVIAIT